MSGDELIRKVVRAEATWRAIVESGWPIESPREGGYVFGATLRHPMKVSVRDLAEGFVRVASQPSASQTEWAKFILHGSPVLDLSGLDSCEIGNLMLEELWEMATGHPLREDILSAAKRFLSKQPEDSEQQE